MRQAVLHAERNCGVAYAVALDVEVVGAAVDAEVVRNPLSFAIHHLHHLPHRRHHRHPCS